MGLQKQGFVGFRQALNFTSSGWVPELFADHKLFRFFTFILLMVYLAPRWPLGKRYSLHIQRRRSRNHEGMAVDAWSLNRLLLGGLLGIDQAIVCLSLQHKGCKLQGLE
ncbi:hypothetical protein KC19_2G097700 [Ceratodon purpureus]|uniref:Uncharacterized protein n=1 Tax=Ceratodon purpureus TaxID=3225 RepID=A0A8T0ITR2_CERPU|nr:hypothetical protein KC19_2G097700 [Ceratodon purpureus]